MMRFIALDLDPGTPRPDTGRSIVVSSVPGDQHSFGAAMAAEFFRKDGWRVHYEPEPSRQGLVDLVAGMWVDVVGLSVATGRDTGTLRQTVAAVRDGSRNPKLLVIAGGEGLVCNPQMIGEIGADAAIAALDVAPRQTLRLADALFGDDRTSSDCATPAAPVSRRRGNRRGRL
jgi:methylmalonyl-CoA mutase cobalamin-binding subunit